MKRFQLHAVFTTNTRYADFCEELEVPAHWRSAEERTERCFVLKIQEGPFTLGLLGALLCRAENGDCVLTLKHGNEDEGTILEQSSAQDINRVIREGRGTLDDVGGTLATAYVLLRIRPPIMPSDWMINLFSKTR